MKVTYNSKLNAYQVIYKDELAQLAGKPLYARKQVTAGKKKPTAAERKAKIRELETWATEQELNCTKAAQEKLAGTTNENLEGEKPILAVDYLKGLSGDRLTTTTKIEQIKAAKLHIRDLILFLEEKHASLYLHKVNKKIALEFANWMTEQKRSFAYKKSRWVRCGYVFNRVMIANEESNLKFSNPFWTLKIEDIAEEEPVIHKKTFTPQLVKLLLDEAKVWQYSKRTKRNKKEFTFQLYAILYILSICGVRPKDVMLMKWEQIDFDNRTLTIEHTKTKKKGIKSVLWLTPHLLELFVTLKDMHKKYKPCSKEYVFSFNPYNRKEANTSMDYYLYISSKTYLGDFFAFFRKKYGLTQSVKTAGKKIMGYSLYSLRATVGTLLSNANFNENNIDYLQGHAPSNTTARFYLDREADPKAATAAMIDYLAYNVAQQPLGKYGLQVAYQDTQTEKLLTKKQAEVNEEVRYIKDGTSLLTHSLLEKLEEEQRKLEEMKKKLLAQGHDEEILEFLKNH